MAPATSVLRRILLVLVFAWVVMTIQIYCNHIALLHHHQSSKVFVHVNVASRSAVDVNKEGGAGKGSGSPYDDDVFPEHHIVFSTGCDSYQNWQSYLFFHTAYKINQPGHVTRIASGCKPRQYKQLVNFHDTVISKLSPQFHVHFTPDYSTVGDDQKPYRYFNKPFGVLHWLEKDLLQHRYLDNKTKFDEAIIMLLDPDMLLLRPLTYDFRSSNVLRWHRGLPPRAGLKVVHGSPWAAYFAFSDGPWRLDLGYVFANFSNSPALNVSKTNAIRQYQGGPPYVATGKDMYDIVTMWCELVPRVYTVYRQQTLGEMFAWSLAAAHLKLPHTLVESFAVSHVDLGEGLEGWGLIDSMKPNELCGYDPTNKETTAKLPYVLHFCQHYILGDWFVSKYGVPSIFFFSCNNTLSLEPPNNIQPGGEPLQYKKKHTSVSVKRDQFMICQIISRFNEAATWYKDEMCERGSANYNKTNRMFRWSDI